MKSLLLCMRGGVGVCVGEGVCVLCERENVCVNVCVCIYISVCVRVCVYVSVYLFTILYCTYFRIQNYNHFQLTSPFTLKHHYHLSFSSYFFLLFPPFPPLCMHPSYSTGRDMGVDVMILPKLAAEENPGKMKRFFIH